MHKITIRGISALTGLMFLASPFVAGAATLQDLQSQVNSLLKQITQLQSQTVVSSGGTGVSSSAVASPAQFRICGILNRNLFVGVRGDDVSGLQEFLQGQGYLSVSPTGYFGPMTAQAVSKWQTSEGVSAIGVFGPTSRGHLQRWCGGTMSNGVLHATPLSGDSPLTVTFTTSVGINDSIPSVDFGDGQIAAMTKDSCVGITAIVGGQGGIRCSLNVTHTYTQNGSYTATLVNGPQKGDVSIKVGGTSTQGSLQADPSSGTAPLSTNFTYHPTSESGTYHIDYGDGSADQMTTQQIYCIKAPCISPVVSSHTYSSAGTYEVVVSPYIACMYSNPRCMIAVMPLAKTTVTVTGSDSNKTFSATPQSGSAPLTVRFNTWLSGFHLNTISYRIDYGDGTSEDAANCNAPADACISAGINTHTYASNGTYTATLNEITNTCPAGAQCFVGPTTKTIAKLQIAVGPSTSGNKPPVISGFSGPTTLSLNSTGTWTINASDPEGGQLSYQVWWGDENVYAPMMNAAGTARDFVQTTTFTHAYANAGTYTVTMLVHDSAGQEAKTSTTVNVGNNGVACTEQYAPVCGRPTGCANTCAPGMACPAICQLYPAQTYGNRCFLDAAGATYLYSGACTSSASY